MVFLATDGKIGYTYGATPSNAASPIAAGFRVPPTGVTETRLGAARDLYQKCWELSPPRSLWAIRCCRRACRRLWHNLPAAIRQEELHCSAAGFRAHEPPSAAAIGSFTPLSVPSPQEIGALGVA